jgi:hypothetical protein
MRTVFCGRRAVAALVFLFVGLQPLSATPWAEVGDGQLRADLELLQAAGVLHGLTIHWPLPWQSVLDEVGGVDLAAQPETVRVAAQRLLAKAGGATAPGNQLSLSLDATNRPSVVYGFDGMSRGEGQAQLSLDHNDDIFSGRISLGGFTPDFGSKANKIMPDGTYFSLRLDDVRLYAGYLDHWWGPGEISALQLSNNARPMPQVGIERSSTQASNLPVLNWLGPWQAEFFLGYLDGPRTQTDEYFSGARLTVSPLPGLELAMARTEEFCGTGHTCVPLRDYFHFSNNPNSPNSTSDELAWDFKYSHALGDMPFQVYMQLMNEDYSWFNHSGTSHLFGASVWLPAPDNPLKLTAEYTNSIATLHPFSFGDDIYGFSYTNGTFVDGMRYRGRTLGFSLDDDATLLSLQGNWSDADGRFYELSLHHATIGSSQAPGANIVTAAPVLFNLAEARVSLPWQSIRLDLAGRMQDDQPRPHNGFAAAVEVAMRAPF